VALADRAVRRIVDEPVGPCGRGEYRRILRRIKIETAIRIPSYAQEFAPRIGLDPVEIRARIGDARCDLGYALRAQEERPHEDQESHEARDRVAGQTDERARADPAERKRPSGLHRDPP